MISREHLYDLSFYASTRHEAILSTIYETILVMTLNEWCFSEKPWLWSTTWASAQFSQRSRRRLNSNPYKVRENRMGNHKGCTMLEPAQAERSKPWIHDERDIESCKGNTGQKDYSLQVWKLHLLQWDALQTENVLIRSKRTWEVFWEGIKIKAESTINYLWNCLNAPFFQLICFPHRSTPQNLQAHFEKQLENNVFLIIFVTVYMHQGPLLNIMLTSLVSELQISCISLQYHLWNSKIYKV